MKPILIFLALLSSIAIGAEKPLNVVFFLADDLGVTDINTDGSDSFYETPNLTKLAKSAVNFTNGYSSSPVCSPTRSAIMTGQNPARTRNTDYFGAPNEYLDGVPLKYDPVANLEATMKRMDKFKKYPLLPAPYHGSLAKEHTTLAEALKKEGYATFFAGKWHLGHEGNYPDDHGFDINIGGNKGGGPYGGKKYFSPYGNPNLTDGPDGEYLTERLGRETADFIKANKEKPFLAYLSFYAVHTPLMAPDELVKKYEEKRKKLGLPEGDFAKEHPRMNRTVHSHAVYAAMIESMDSAIGHVLDTLEAEGLADNTLIIFTSDNGGLSTSEGSPTTNLPFRAGKGWLYEGGVRVPVLVRSPATGNGGASCAEPIYSTDYFPTILAAAGHDLLAGQHLDGRSFLTYLTTPSTPPSGRDLIWHYPHWGNQGGIPGTAIRQGKWKLIRFAWMKGDELYDLEADPGESNNIAAQNPEVVATLTGRIDEFLKDTKAYQPFANLNFEGKFDKW
jgi:arylsulfatase A-like enzyme